MSFTLVLVCPVPPAGAYVRANKLNRNTILLNLQDMHIRDGSEEHSSFVQVCIVPSCKNNCNNYIFPASDLRNVGRSVLPK